MKKSFIYVFSLGLVFSMNALAKTTLDPEELRSQYKIQLGKIDPVEGSTRHWLSHHTVLFVNGLGGTDLSASEYKDILENDFFFPKRNFLVFTPNASTTVEENAQKIYSEILLINLLRDRDKPFIVIGHSLGGAELLLMAATHPELVNQKIIERLVIMQGPVGGAPLADLLRRLVEVRAPNGLWDPLDPLFYIFKFGFLNGALSIAPENYLPVLSSKFSHLDNASKNSLSEATDFVTVAQDPKSPQYPDSTIQMLKYGRNIYGEVKDTLPTIPYSNFDDFICSLGASDDIVPLNSQSIPGFGMTFKPLHGSHMNFLTSHSDFSLMSMSTSTKAEVRAFLRALLITISHQ
jgi:pimeloyl-ACP methyl ester carboxylesterase